MKTKSKRGGARPGAGRPIKPRTEVRIRLGDKIIIGGMLPITIKEIVGDVIRTDSEYVIRVIREASQGRKPGEE